jgi:hypothetical protein
MHIPSAKALKVSPFMRKRVIMTAETLDSAVRGCDTYAAQKVLRGSLALGYTSICTSLLTFLTLGKVASNCKMAENACD